MTSLTKRLKFLVLKLAYAQKWSTASDLDAKTDRSQRIKVRRLRLKSSERFDFEVIDWVNGLLAELPAGLAAAG